MNEIKIKELIHDINYDPGITSICGSDREKILDDLYQKLHISSEILSKIYRGDLSPQIFIEFGKIPVNEISSFNLKELIVKITNNYCPDHLFYSDNPFKEIDIVKFKSLCENFIYYWYASCDDIVLWPNDFKWCLFIRHDGAIFLAKKQSLG